MKSIKQLSFIGLAIMFVMNSCKIEKRIYSSGYHIDWKNGNRNSNKQELVKDNMGKQPKQNKIATILRLESVTKTIDNTLKVIDDNIITSNINERIYLPKKEKIKFYLNHELITADEERKINHSDKPKIINEIINISKNTDTESKLNVMAIAGSICSFFGLLLLIKSGAPFLFGTLGTIFSAIGLRQTSKNGEKDKEFPIIGLVIGILIVLGVLYALFTSLSWLNNLPPPF
jgi:hypothetical protein